LLQLINFIYILSSSLAERCCWKSLNIQRLRALSILSAFVSSSSFVFARFSDEALAIFVEAFNHFHCFSLKSTSFRGEKNLEWMSFLMKRGRDLAVEVLEEFNGL
jgi:hypothetical protein